MGLFDFLLNQKPITNADIQSQPPIQHEETGLKMKVKEYKKGRKLPDDYIVFDLETTGLNPEESEIIEIGAIKYHGGIEVDRFHTYVKPYSPITSKITKINGITNSMVKDAPRIDTAIKSFENFVENLNDIDVSGIEATFSTIEGGTPLREDISNQDLELSNHILKHAPKSEDGYFIVPKIIE